MIPEGPSVWMYNESDILSFSVSTFLPQIFSHSAGFLCDFLD